tara:strand:- start:5309 stop:7009 length:1701 start_codon:yes stop_codon:yes gene_type:complete
LRLKQIVQIALGISLVVTAFYTVHAQTEPFSVVDATISSTQAAISAKQVTCSDIVQQYLQRINDYNLTTHSAPPLNAIVNINPKAVEEAQRLDDYYTANQAFKGPLHCVTVIIKDNIDVTEFPSSSGSLALVDNLPKKDAFLVKQLKDAGAIILAHGTMDEFAAGAMGISGRSGRTGNAYDPNKNAGGSSGGSAVAVSANFALVGIGTDNSGSVRIPAAYNGIYGLRPSTGQISQQGIFPRGNLDGVAGPMARTVEDMTKVFAVIAVPDPNDPKTQGVKRNQDYAQALENTDLTNIRIGILSSVAGVDQFRNMSRGNRLIYRQVLKTLKNAGATIVANVQLPGFDVNRDDNMAGEIDDINAYLKQSPSHQQSYQDLCNSGLTSTLFDGRSGCLTHGINTPGKNSKAYQSVLKRFAKNRAYVQDVMKKNKLDALFVPIDTRGAAQKDINFGNLNLLVASNAGLPGLAIIGGFTKSHRPMPVGVELIGRPDDEETLFKIAYAYEQSQGPRPGPQLQKSKRAEGAIDIETLNDLYERIGRNSYLQVLKDGTPQDLTPKRFSTIVRETQQ